MSKKNKKHPVINILILACFVILMCYLTMKDHAEEILSQLSTIGFLDILLLVFVSTWMYVISGVILAKLARKCQPEFRVKDGIQISFLTMFTSNVMYSATSKLVQYFLFYTKKIKMDAATCIIALEFLSYQLTMLILSMSMMLAYHTYYASVLPNEIGIAWFGTLISFLPLIGLCLLLWVPKVQKWIKTSLLFAVRHIHLSLNIDEIDQRITAFSQALIQIKESFLNDHRLLWSLLLWNVLRHIAKHCIPIVIAFVLHIPMSLEQAWLLMMLSMFLDLWLTAIPIAGKHGFAEAGFISVFGVLIGNVTASSMMILWRFVTFYANTLIGGLILIASPELSFSKIKELKKTPS